jgi:hypothetical protein
LDHEQSIIDDVKDGFGMGPQIGECLRGLEGFENPTGEGAIDVRPDRRDVHAAVGGLGGEDAFEDHGLRFRAIGDRSPNGDRLSATFAQTFP